MITLHCLALVLALVRHLGATSLKSHLTSIGRCNCSGQRSLLQPQNLGFYLCWWSIPCPPAHTSTTHRQLCRCKKTHLPHCCIGNTEQFLINFSKRGGYFKWGFLSCSVPVFIAAISVAVAEGENLAKEGYLEVTLTSTWFPAECMSHL